MVGHTSDLQVHLEDEEVFVSAPVVIDEDESIHGATGFCSDLSCPCHEDPELIGEVNQMYRDGFLTVPEAMNLVTGKTI